MSLMVSDETHDVETIHCSSWDDFHRRARYSTQSYERLFRGQRDTTWTLTAAIHRHLNMRDKDDRKHMAIYECDKLEKFKVLASGLRNFRQTARWDENTWWARAQHFGLATPLLDWTESPFVAAFFAYADAVNHSNPTIRNGRLPDLFEQVSPVAVWEYSVPDREPVEELEVISVDMASGERQRSQGGRFTRIRTLAHTDMIALLRDRNRMSLLRRFILPGEQAGDALHSLDQMNIRYTSLFPDIEGVVRHVNFEHYLWAQSFVGAAIESMRNDITTGLSLVDPKDRKSSTKLP
ncbi:MAG: FRG domain-containing protein [Phycisphaeraceae bacterium]|nr:MAG: FRG domain-containing protein [Phycisphaeraceae bacterium]